MNKYELWEAGKTMKTRKRLFIRSDHNGERIRRKLPKSAKKTWTVEAQDYFHAMTEYWKHMDFGTYGNEDHIFPGDEL